MDKKSTNLLTMMMNQPGVEEILRERKYLNDEYDYAKSDTLGRFRISEVWDWSSRDMRDLLGSTAYNTTSKTVRRFRKEHEIDGDLTSIENALIAGALYLKGEIFLREEHRVQLKCIEKAKKRIGVLEASARVDLIGEILRAPDVRIKNVVREILKVSVPQEKRGRWTFFEQNQVVWTEKCKKKFFYDRTKSVEANDSIRRHRNVTSWEESQRNVIVRYEMHGRFLLEIVYGLVEQGEIWRMSSYDRARMSDSTMYYSMSREWYFVTDADLERDLYLDFNFSTDRLYKYHIEAPTGRRFVRMGEQGGVGLLMVDYGSTKEFVRKKRMLTPGSIEFTGVIGQEYDDCVNSLIIDAEVCVKEMAEGVRINCPLAALVPITVDGVGEVQAFTDTHNSEINPTGSKVVAVQHVGNLNGGMEGFRSKVAEYQSKGFKIISKGTMAEALLLAGIGWEYPTQAKLKNVLITSPGYQEVQDMRQGYAARTQTVFRVYDIQMPKYENLRRDYWASWTFQDLFTAWETGYKKTIHNPVLEVKVFASHYYLNSFGEVFEPHYLVISREEYKSFLRKQWMVAPPTKVEISFEVVE